MKQYLLIYIGFSLLTLSATASSQQVPEDLLYQGKPIDALCFNLEGNNVIQLKDCGINKEKYILSGQNSEFADKGYIGYQWKDKTTSFISVGYSYYKVFPADNNQYWVYSVNNDGGSGEFTAIYLVKRSSPTTLETKTVASGDRCNGGIQDVQQQNHKLTFSVNLTAYDFLALTNQNPHQLKPYDDLAACAVCCTGKAFYDIDLNLKPKILYVDLGSISNPDEIPTQGKYQVCFNTLFAKYIIADKTKLNPAQLEQFGKEFNEKCVK